MIKCNNCGTEYEGSACPVCGANSEKLCPQCGKICSSDMIFCNGCGHRFEPVPEEGTPSLNAADSSVNTNAGSATSGDSAQFNGYSNEYYHQNNGYNNGNNAPYYGQNNYYGYYQPTGMPIYTSSQKMYISLRSAPAVLFFIFSLVIFVAYAFPVLVVDMGTAGKLGLVTIWNYDVINTIFSSQYTMKILCFAFYLLSGLGVFMGIAFLVTCTSRMARYGDYEKGKYGQTSSLMCALIFSFYVACLIVAIFISNNCGKVKNESNGSIEEGYMPILMILITSVFAFITLVCVVVRIIISRDKNNLEYAAALYYKYNGARKAIEDRFNAEYNNYVYYGISPSSGAYAKYIDYAVKEPKKYKRWVKEMQSSCEHPVYRHCGFICGLAVIFLLAYYVVFGIFYFNTYNEKNFKSDIKQIALDQTKASVTEMWGEYTNGNEYFIEYYSGEVGYIYSKAKEINDHIMNSFDLSGLEKINNALVFLEKKVKNKSCSYARIDFANGKNVSSVLLIDYTIGMDMYRERSWRVRVTINSRVNQEGNLVRVKATSYGDSYRLWYVSPNTMGVDMSKYKEEQHVKWSDEYGTYEGTVIVE